MELTKEQQAILDGSQGETPALYRFGIFQIPGAVHKFRQMSVTRRRDLTEPTEQIDFYEIRTLKGILLHLLVHAVAEMFCDIFAV